MHDKKCSCKKCSCKEKKPAKAVGELKNMVIAQSGGPSMVINQSLVGAVWTAIDSEKIGELYGAIHGIDGILNENFYNMRELSEEQLARIAQTPSSALGSVRKKPTEDDCKKIFEILKKRNVGYFFYIGGNDSAETVYIVSEMAEKNGIDLKCYHIPKTIDNDLCGNDHTPGYGSAAKYVALAFMGDNLDNVALGGVKINVVMGRHAGFLTAAAALARRYDDDGPHLIYLPERAFSPDAFVKDVEKVLKKYGRCVVAVSEGISDAEGNPIVTSLGKAEKDSHGNVQLSGTGALGDMLSELIKSRLGIKRVRADTFGYIQRSFPIAYSVEDRREAFSAGEAAVKNALKSKEKSGSIAIVRKDSKKYAVEYKCIPLKTVAAQTKTMPAKFINKAGNNVTQAFIDYAKPIVGELPIMERIID